MKQIHGDVASTLKEIYLEAAKKNPSYSLRAFASKLGLSSGGLSQILGRKKKLSVSRAHEIAEVLKLKDAEKEHFVLLAQLENAKTMSLKAEIYERLRKSPRSNGQVHNLALDQFKMISDWYGLAILELLATFGSGWGAEKISSFLGITKTQAEVTLERLMRLELVEQNDRGGFARVADRVMVTSHLPNEAIRNYYKGVVEKATGSIDTQSPSEKVIGTEVFAFDSSQVAQVKELTDKYLDQLIVLARQGSDRNDLYQVMIDVFRLNPEKSKKGLEV